MTEERSIGYDEGYQAGWNAAMDAKPEQPAQQEPVYVQTRQKGFSDWGSLLDPKHRNSKWAKGVEMRLLYTTPQPAQRKPLSVDEIFEAIRPLYSSDKAAWLAVNHSKDEYRAIEAAHGIGEKK